MVYARGHRVVAAPCLLRVIGQRILGTCIVAKYIHSPQHIIVYVAET